MLYISNLHDFCLPERRRFYQDVSISQGESKCYVSLRKNLTLDQELHLLLFLMMKVLDQVCAFSLLLF